MSINNEIIIEEVKPDMFIVREVDADTGTVYLSKRPIKGLKKAIQSVGDVDYEYGPFFKFLED